MDFVSVGQLALWHHPTKAKKAKGRVLLVHGISEHSARHLNTVNHLNDHGFEVVRFDLQGAGRSGGRRQFMNHFEDYVDDTAQAFHWIARHLEPQPLFLMGHSLGGAIAIFFASVYSKSLQGVVLTSPAFKVGDGVSAFRIAVGKMLAGVAPNLRIPHAIGDATLSRDAQVELDYRNDPLCSHFNTVRQGTQILKALPLIPERIKRVTSPVFIAHGTHDRVIRLDGSFELMQLMGPIDKTLMIMPGGYHEPHNDIDRLTFFTSLTQWLNDRVA